MLYFPLPPQERISAKYLKEEYKKAKINIYEVGCREWRKTICPLTDDKPPSSSEKYLGLYYNSGPFYLEEYDLTLPKNFIIIDKHLSNSWKLITFYHELGHHACSLSKCPCSLGKNGFITRQTEMHADLSAIFLATKRKFKKMTLNLVTDTIADLDHVNFNRIWNATRIVKHPIFEEATSFVKSEMKGWLKSHLRLKEKYEAALVDVDTRTGRWEPSKFLKEYGELSIAK